MANNFFELKKLVIILLFAFIPFVFLDLILTLLGINPIKVNNFNYIGLKSAIFSLINWLLIFPFFCILSYLFLNLGVFMNNLFITIRDYFK